MKALIRLYPREWRRRYGDEMAQLIAAQPKTLRLAVDLIAGAIDARVNPQIQAGAMNSPASKGETVVMKLLTYCQPYEISAADYRRSVAWMLGVTIVLSAVYITLKRTFGENAIIEAFGVSTFPIAVLASSWETYLKRYSIAARVTMIAGFGAIVFLISLGAEYVARAL